MTDVFAECFQLLRALPDDMRAALRGLAGPGWLLEPMFRDGSGVRATWVDGLPYPEGEPEYYLPVDPTLILRAALGAIPERTPSRHDALVVVFTDCWHARVVVRLGGRLVEGKGSGSSAHEAAIQAAARFWDNVTSPAPPLELSTIG